MAGIAVQLSKTSSAADPTVRNTSSTIRNKLKTEMIKANLTVSLGRHFLSAVWSCFIVVKSDLANQTNHKAKTTLKRFLNVSVSFKR